MSAMTGIWDLRAMAGRASASSWLGQATRAMSQPEAVSSAICCSVALMSVVGVVVIDWTEMGASPPTSTLPTLILRVGRRGARTGGGADGLPSEMGVPAGTGSRISPPGGGDLLSGAGSGEPDRGDDVGVDEQRGHAEQPDGDGVGDRQRLGRVHRGGGGQVADPVPRLLRGLPQRAGDVSSVERQEWDEVEDEQ